MTVSWTFSFHKTLGKAKEDSLVRNGNDINDIAEMFRVQVEKHLLNIKLLHLYQYLWEKYTKEAVIS